MKREMKALILEEGYKLNFTQVEVPEVREGYALVKVSAISICGSDYHAYRGNSLLLTYPRILGHELCGTVVTINGAEDTIHPGDKVCVLPYISCGICRPCSQGRTNCCEELKVLGVHAEGGLAEYVSVPAANLIKVPDQMEDKAAALVEPLSVGAHCAKRGKINEKDHVLVLGAGPIGVSAALIAQTYGANVMMADVSRDRRSFIQEQFGLCALDPLDEDFHQQLRKAACGNYPNKVIDSTGNQKSMANSINYLAYGGSLIFVGLQSGTLDISDAEFHKKEADIYASRVATKEDFLYVMDCILSGKVKPKLFITDTADFDQAKEAFERWIEKGTQVFKGVITIA